MLGADTAAVLQQRGQGQGGVMEETCAVRVSGAGAGALDGMASAAREARVSG